MIVSVQPNVLIIEDEPRLRDLLADVLKSWGVGSTAARSGEEALRMIDTDPADILLLDLNLPGIGGIETLRQMRQRGIDAPAIILTGFGDLPAAQAAIELGATAFLTKPARLGELEQAIDRARKQLKPDLLIFAGNAVDDLSAAPPGNTPAVRLAELERNHILATLDRYAGNRTATAKELGISRRTLQYRLAEYQAAGWVEGA